MNLPILPIQQQRSFIPIVESFGIDPLEEIKDFNQKRGFLHDGDTGHELELMEETEQGEQGEQGYQSFNPKKNLKEALRVPIYQYA